MISFDSKNKTFKLDTPNTSYVIGVVDFDQLVNLYYGDKIADTEGLEARIQHRRARLFARLRADGIWLQRLRRFQNECALDKKR